MERAETTAAIVLALRGELRRKGLAAATQLGGQPCEKPLSGVPINSGCVHWSCRPQCVCVLVGQARGVSFS